jgi:hypothetical protein
MCTSPVGQVLFLLRKKSESKKSSLTGDCPTTGDCGTGIQIQALRLPNLRSLVRVTFNNNARDFLKFFSFVVNFLSIQ